jgi:acetyltransferase-like isoleucine patch superfamily enzyme
VGIVRSVVNAAARRAKGNTGYGLHADLPLRAVLALARVRGAMALRGALFARPRFRSARGLVFMGRGVRLSAAYLIHAGRSLTLDDHCVVDALSREGIRFGDNVKIGRFATLKCTGVATNLGRGVRIGDNSNIGDYGYVTGDGGVAIGRNVLFGPHVKVHAENHVFDRADLPIKEQGVAGRGVTIEDDCWIGSGAIILDGVTIGRGSVVAAGAVVNRSVEPWSVVGGVPARVLRTRPHGT